MELTGHKDEQNLTTQESKDRDHLDHSRRCCTLSRTVVIAIVVVMVLVYVLALGLGLGLGLRQTAVDGTTVVGAVAADHSECSEVGRKILARGGSAVDAAIAALLCNGVRQPHSMGIGGGCFMLVYNKQLGRAEVFNGRETAPAAATRERISNHSIKYGPLSIGVFGEINAYYAAHQRHGILPWKELFSDAIRMARDGHGLSHSTARALRILESGLGTNISVGAPDLCVYFCDDEGRPLREGDTVYMLELATTLERIAQDGPDYLYKNEGARKLVKDIQAMGGLLTLDDMQQYQTRVEEALQFPLNDVILYTPGAPSGGPVLGLILQILSGFNMTADDLTTTAAEAATLHKMAEAFKFAYADRWQLGDPHFVDVVELVKKMTSKSYADYLRRKIDVQRTHNVSYYTNLTSDPRQDFGTTHISVLAPDGSAVSVTSTVNYYFGSRRMSRALGIILNNEMADFSRSSSVTKTGRSSGSNLVQPGKQPLSSMAPAVFVENSGNVRFVTGSAGGMRITTVNAQVAARVLWLGQSLKQATEHKRIHHQLIPNRLVFEYGFPQEPLSVLANQYGHTLQERTTYMAVVQSISRHSDNGEISAVSDWRKHANASLLYASDLDK